jgi:hypothetical protein
MRTVKLRLNLYLKINKKLQEGPATTPAPHGLENTFLKKTMKSCQVLGIV